MTNCTTAPSYYLWGIYIVDSYPDAWYHFIALLSLNDLMASNNWTDVLSFQRKLY